MKPESKTATKAVTKAVTKMTDWTYARRDLLKTLGVGAACLPLLRARPARAAGLAKHFVCFASSEGYRMKDWAPATGPLAGQTLPFATAPLEPHKADVIILPDLGNPGFTGPGGGGGHGSYGSIYWGLEPGVKGTYKEPKSKTIDQEIGHALPRPESGRVTLPLHVQLNRAPQSSPAPGSSKCFWLGRGQPINPIGDPYATYMEIFGGAPMGGGANGGAEDPAVKRLMTQRKSILDYVGRNLEAFKARLGGEDRTAIDAHFNSVRDLERQLQSAGSGAGNAQCGGAPGAMIDLNDGLKYPDILKAHMSLIIQALKCGVTNVATVQLSDSSGNNINFAFVEGIPARGTGYKTAFRNFHDVGHNPVLNGVDHKRIVDRWMMQQLANFMTDMKAVQVEGGSLLDQSVILFGNHMQDGSNHDENKIPWVVAGKGGGYFNTGQCPPSAGKPLNGVMSDICAAMGVASPFGPTWAGIKKV
jgi:hypothetical protein